MVNGSNVSAWGGVTSGSTSGPAEKTRLEGESESAVIRVQKLTDSCPRHLKSIHLPLRESQTHPTHTTLLAKAKLSGHRDRVQSIRLKIHTWAQVPREYHMTQDHLPTPMDPLPLGRYSSSNSHHNTHQPSNHLSIEHLILGIITV